MTQNAAEYGFDTDEIVVAGVSAGGRLSLRTGILGIVRSIPRNRFFELNSRQLTGLCSAILPALLLACAGSPSVRHHDTVSVEIFSDSDFYLDTKKAGYLDPNLAPETLTREGAAQAMRDCASLWNRNASLAAIIAPLCVLSGAAAGAAAGAVAQAAAGAPVEADADLRTVIDRANAGNAPDIWRTLLHSSLEAAARERGKDVVAYPDGEPVHIVVEDLYWTPSSGKRLAIRGKFIVATRSAHGFARRSFRVTSRSYKVEEWLAEEGERVGRELSFFLSEVADRTWAIVDR